VRWKLTLAAASFFKRMNEIQTAVWDGWRSGTRIFCDFFDDLGVTSLSDCCGPLRCV